MDMLHVIGSHLKKINVLVDDVKAKESDLVWNRSNRSEIELMLFKS